MSFRLSKANGEIPTMLAKTLGDTSIAFANAHSTRYDKRKNDIRYDEETSEQSELRKPLVISATIGGYLHAVVMLLWSI